MQAILLYLLKMTVCSGVMMLYYYLFLLDRRFHLFNRYYLLSVLTVSLLLPLIRISLPGHSLSSGPLLYVQTLDAITIWPATSHFSENHTPATAMLIYCSVALIFLGSFVSDIVKISRLKNKYAVKKIGNIQFYDTDEPTAPFSFFRNIFWNRRIALDSEKGRQIFRHEYYHTSHFHSLDLVTCHIAICFTWINPFFYLVKKELAITHEYLADRFTVKQHNPHDYAELLVFSALRNKPHFPPAHLFFHSPLKRRIAMILKNASQHRITYFSRIMSFVLVIAIFCSFALTPAENRSSSGSNSLFPAPASESAHADTVPLKKVEFEADFEGGPKGWQDFLIKNLNYPKNAIKEKKQGEALITFIVNTDQSVEDCVITKNPGNGLGEEALRVIRLSSGKWHPARDHGQVVRSYKIQPIIFRLEP